MQSHTNSQSLKAAKHDFEKAYIQQVIEDNDCRLRKAAEALEIHYSALLTKIKAKGIAITRPTEASHGL
tara:strand:+ start:458 stop:664 length:207 start_codon:yes stop_codon:yes gene_type:complete